MGATLAEKIIAQAAGRARVRAGEVVTCAGDLAMIHDSGGPRRVQPILDGLGVGLRDADRVVLISDHFVQAVDAESAAILDLTRKWAATQKLKYFHDMQGICHVVLPERGHLRPGMFVVDGALAPGGFGQGHRPASLRPPGPWWRALPGGGVQRRHGAGAGHGRTHDAGQHVGGTGAMAGLVAPDETTEAFVTAAGDPGDWRQWRSDGDARYLETHAVDAANLPPQVAAPHSPANAGPCRITLPAWRATAPTSLSATGC